MKKLTALLLTIIVILFAVSTFTAQTPAQAAPVYGASVAHGITHAVKDTYDMKYNHWAVTGEFPVMCFDPLLTSTVILDPELCQGNSQPVAQKRAERTVEPSTPIVETTVENDTPAVTVDEPTQEPEQPEQPESPVVTDDKPEKPADDKPLGNPGNTKAVGHAGENPNGQGTMPLDNAGGNGNGEHGNQGQNGNGGNNNH